MSVNATYPGELFGGTWVQIKGRFLIGVGAVDNNTNLYWGNVNANYDIPRREKGGEALHYLSENDLPIIDGAWQTIVPYKHATVGVAGHAYGRAWDTHFGEGAPNGNGTQMNFGYGFHFGGNGAHNNMPPYYAVYMWQRTA